MNHPFVDGNQRVGHVARETFLLMNGFQLDAGIDDSEFVILRLAAGQLDRQALTEWVATHVTTADTQTRTTKALHASKRPLRF